ncbi:MAG: FAD:protein FMN transferase [Verrucomicrobiota bacterium]
MNFARFAAIVLLGAAPPAPAAPPPLHAVSGRTMGTTWSVKWCGAPDDTNGVARAAGDVVGRLDALLSTYDAQSEISRFNRSPGSEFFPVAPETAGVFAAALQAARATDGAFDPTVFPLVQLWGFGPQRELTAPPTPTAIETARRRVGHQHLLVRPDPPALRKLRDISVDLSGIAKGYAVDAVVARLESLGIHHCLVDIGGELKARGHSPQGRPWRVGIERPAPDARQIERVVALSDCAIATSGGYRNFHELAGRRFAHIIDPRTGWPVTNHVASVSVVHPSATQADALATSLVVLGADEGMKLAGRHGWAVRFVLHHNGGYDERTTAEFDRVVVVEK